MRLLFEGGFYSRAAFIRGRLLLASLRYADTVGPPQKCDQPLANSYKASIILVNVMCPTDGNSTIMEFEIQYRKASEQWASVKYSASVSQPFIVKDLTSFTWYNVRVRAANKYSYAENNTSFSNPVRVRTAEGGEISVFYTDSDQVPNSLLKRELLTANEV